MNKKKPYAVSIYCPISQTVEEVYFYEVDIGGHAYLRFAGCDHEFHKCEECAKCQKDAYSEMISTIK